MKYNRHAKILELIEKYMIETQEELADRLREHGIDVTQATVSRDIRELKLIKVMTDDEHYRYAQVARKEGAISDKLLTIFSESFTGIDYAGNIAVIKTLPGMAQGAASALDALKWSEIVGTIAGDDTIMIVCRTEKNAQELVHKLNKLIR
ncbi:MAG: arginine repressor [Acetivibrionales bacterium]|jgi:transcriptional regulator of arginine metabolism